MNSVARESIRTARSVVVKVGTTALTTPTGMFDASRLAGLIPPAELVVFEASGHFPFVDEPGRFALVFDAFMDAEL